MTHLFFANDSILFCKAYPKECRKLVEIFKLYEDASGQKINAEKLSIFFSHNTFQQLRKEVLNTLGSRHNKYLGLHTLIGKKNGSLCVD